MYVRVQRAGRRYGYRPRQPAEIQAVARETFRIQAGDSSGDELLFETRELRRYQCRRHAQQRRVNETQHQQRIRNTGRHEHERFNMVHQLASFSRTVTIHHVKRRRFVHRYLCCDRVQTPPRSHDEDNAVKTTPSVQDMVERCRAPSRDASPEIRQAKRRRSGDMAMNRGRSDRMEPSQSGARAACASGTRRLRVYARYAVLRVRGRCGERAHR